MCLKFSIILIFLKIKSAKMYICKEQYISKDNGVEVDFAFSQTLCVPNVAFCFGEDFFKDK